MNEIVIAPEWLAIANIYLERGSIEETARALAIPAYQVTETLGKREVRAYLDNVYLDLGYRNRSTIAAAMDKIIEQKMNEMEESEMGSSKDIAELLMMAHKMRMDEIKALNTGDSIKQQTNVQINNPGGANYGAFLQKLMEPQ